MARVVHGDREIFRAMCYVQPDNDYMDHVERGYASLTDKLSGKAAEFMDRAKSKYEQVRDSGSLRKARALLRQVGSLWGKDCIQHLETVTQVQNAPYSMRRYIMAEPTIRRLYHEGRCEGYGSSYVDLQPDVVGKDYLDYQKVDNGWMHVNDDKWEATTYSNDYPDDQGIELTLDEQDDVRSAWDIVRNAIYFEVDPTSKRDADL